MAESSGGDKPFVYMGWVGPDPQHQAGSQVFCQETLLGLEGSRLWAHITPSWLGTAEMGGLRAQVGEGRQHPLRAETRGPLPGAAS